jgi:Flp pilus assembly protein TadB
MVLIAAACSCAALASGLLAGPRRPMPVRPRAPRRPGQQARAAQWVPAGVASVFVFAIVGWPWGLAAAVLVGGWIRRVTRRREGLGAGDLRREEADLATAAVLLAAALHAGAPVRAATAAVGAAVGDRTGAALERVAAEGALGAPADAAWRRFGVSTPAAARFASMMAAAESGGAPPVAALRALAADARASAAAWEAEQAHRAGIRAVAPMGLCFLPAFVLVGVVPVAAGAFHSLVQ